MTNRRHIPAHLPTGITFADDRQSPHQVIGDGKFPVRFVGRSAVVAAARGDEGTLITLANASCDRRGDQIVTSFMAHDGDLPAGKPGPNWGIDRNTPNLGAIDEIVGLT